MQAVFINCHKAHKLRALETDEINDALEAVAPFTPWAG